MPEMRTRPADQNDATVISALVLRSKASNGYDDAFMAACVDELTVSAGEIDANTVWMAELGDRPVGFFSMIDADENATAEIRMFFVEPDMKGRGVGRLLWQKMEALAHESAVVALTLDADPAAVPFYRAMGMEIVGESPSGSIPGRMLPRMRKALSL